MRYEDFIEKHAPWLTKTDFSETCGHHGGRCRVLLNGAVYAVCVHCGCLHQYRMKVTPGLFGVCHDGMP